MSQFPLLFTSGEVQRLVGVSQRQLTYWDQSALISPHGRDSAGRGSHRLYTVVDVVCLKTIRRLRESGISLQKIRSAMKFLSDLPDEPVPLAELEVVTDGNTILVVRSDASLVEVPTGQMVLRLPLSTLLSEVQQSIGVDLLAGSTASAPATLRTN